MALGRFHINVDLDTASDPDDTTLLAAPGAGQTIYIQWLTIITTTAQASTTIQIEDGVGGDVLDIFASTAVGATTQSYANTDKDEGLQMTANTLLNATTIGGTTLAGRVIGEVVVR